MNVGVISDTHGLIRPEALDALAGSELIIHAGDVGSEGVLYALEAIAPVHVVRGNCDLSPWAESLPYQRLVQAGDCRLFVVHDLKWIPPGRLPADVQAVVSGHTHVPLVRSSDNVVYINPGSAGPRRFRLPIAVARIHISGTSLETEIVNLDPSP